MGLQDERVLVEDDYTDYPDFTTLCEVHHGYPATSLQWQPASAASYAWSQKSPQTELLATTGDALRVWEYMSDAPPPISNYVGRQPSSGGHSLTLKTALSGVRRLHTLLLFALNVSLPSAIESPEPVNWCSIDQLLVERESTEPCCDLFDRHHLHGVEY